MSEFLPHARLHQLPPRWDGGTVEWSEWQVDHSSLRFHTLFGCCPWCGTLAERVHAVGKVRADAPRTVLVGRSRSGYQLGRLHAYRCTACMHDQVEDLVGVTWDLDDDDYGDEGSWSR